MRKLTRFTVPLFCLYLLMTGYLSSTAGAQMPGPDGSWSMRFERVDSLDFSSDEQAIALSAFPRCCTEQVIQVVDANSGAVRFPLPRFPLAFSPDGTYLATVDYRRQMESRYIYATITLVSPTDGRDLLQLEPSLGAGRANIAFSSGGDTFITSVIACWTCRPGMPGFSILSFHRAGESVPLWRKTLKEIFHDLALSPDGKNLVLLSFTWPDSIYSHGRSLIQFRRGEDGEVLRSIYEEGTEYKDISYSPDGETVAVVSNYQAYSKETVNNIFRHEFPSRGRVLLFRADDGQRAGTLGEGMGVILHHSFSPDGRMLVTFGSDGILFWRVSDGVLLYQIPRVAETYIDVAAISPRWGKIAYFQKDLWKRIEPTSSLIVRNNPMALPLKAGDLDDNNVVDINDVVLSLRLAVGLVDPSGYQKSVGDVYEDGQLNVVDSVMILRRVAGVGR